MRRRHFINGLLGRLRLPRPVGAALPRLRGLVGVQQRHHVLHGPKPVRQPGGPDGADFKLGHYQGVRGS